MNKLWGIRSFFDCDVRWSFGIDWLSIDSGSTVRLIGRFIICVLKERVNQWIQSMESMNPCECNDHLLYIACWVNHFISFQLIHCSSVHFIRSISSQSFHRSSMSSNSNVANHWDHQICSFIWLLSFDWSRHFHSIDHYAFSHRCRLRSRSLFNSSFVSIWALNSLQAVSHQLTHSTDPLLDKFTIVFCIIPSELNLRVLKSNGSSGLGVAWIIVSGFRQ